MKKILFTPAMRSVTILTLALAALTACTSTDYVGTEEEARIASGERAITFGFDVPAPTRASGSEAATALSNQFIVFGEKNESSAAAPTAGNLVFPNYKVSYTSNTAYTTTSNTKDWEYVGAGYTSTDAANIKLNGTAVGTGDQTIKYWDYAATSYTFTALSALPADITAGKVIVNKLYTGSSVYDKGYEVTVTDEADLTKLYFADRVNIEKSANKDRTHVNEYGGNVTFTFRNVASQIRVAMYETIPGYEVKVTKFYYVNDANPTFETMTTENTTNFVANVPNVSPVSPKTSVAGTFTVKYYEKNTANEAAKITNHPTISFLPTTETDSKNFITLGTEIINATKLGETAPTATYDKAEKAFTTVFPQEANTKNLKLKIDYQLKNTVTNEVINITGKTAEVPAQYLCWKPNFKYTYLFKITDDELYPITFDAVSIEAEDGQAEYITTVSEPSITTFGVKGSKYSIGKNEYEAGTDIYATIMDGSSVVDFTLGTNVNVYLATTSDATNFPITEASVAESLAELSTGTKKITTVLKNADGTTSFTAAPAKVLSVPSEDGKTTDIKALKLTGVKEATTATTAYVIEYIKTAATYNTTSETHTFTDADLATWEASNYKLYDNEDGTTPATATNAAKTYYKRVSVKNVGVYAYKVIHVTAVPEP